MSERDPLADPLAIALYPLIFKAAESGATKDYYIEAARVARDHIAAEIEASIDGREPQNNAARWIRDGKRIAASIARRENG